MKEIEITLEELQVCMQRLPDKEQWELNHGSFPFTMPVLKKTNVDFSNPFTRNEECKTEPRVLSFYLERNTENFIQEWKTCEKLIIV